MASRHDRESADQLHQLEARLGNAGRGGIHSRALAAINGYLDRLAPANSEIVSLRPIRAIGGTPAEVAVVWKGRSQFPDTGFLLWQAHRTLSPDRGLFGSYRRWWLADNWRFDADHRRSFIGLPGQEQRHDDVAGQAFFFTVGDATGDGEPDVLVQFNTEGSASCADWRLLSTDHDIVESILTRSTCDGGVSIADGMVRIKRAVHGPGCSIHGCGDYHRTLLRRAGDHWVVADRSIVGKPYADH
jgi:hypothetical protein